MFVSIVLMWGIMLTLFIQFDFLPFQQIIIFTKAKVFKHRAKGEIMEIADR